MQPGYDRIIAFSILLALRRHYLGPTPPDYGTPERNHLNDVCNRSIMDTVGLRRKDVLFKYMEGSANIPEEWWLPLVRLGRVTLGRRWVDALLAGYDDPEDQDRHMNVIPLHGSENRGRKLAEFTG